jgi:uncharacterized protein (TIGR02453 family)
MADKGHFGPALFRFLEELQANNERDWFNANKARYESEVRNPSLRFITDFGGPLAKISRRLLAEARPIGGSLMRVHRDTRFSKDKAPYKTNVGIHFRHDAGKDVHAPGYYLHLATDNVFLGAGMWHPDPPALAKIRDALVDDPDAWKRIIAGKAFNSSFELSGESLKRPPQGYDAAHPLIEDLKRKDFIAVRNYTRKEACAPDFINTVAADCAKAAPLMSYLTKAIGLPW